MTAPEWAPGHIVGGKYTVRAELGRGERMRTYAALTEPNREVVLRTVGADDAAELDRTAETLGVLATLPEAHFLRTLEVARDEVSGARFVATDRSRNPSLASLVELCPLTLDEGVAFAGKLGGALDELHDKGVLHLRLRPTSVFVGAMPTGAVEIADPCVPRLDELPVERMRWTAPEAREGNAGRDDAAADVFTAALVVFFAMTGKSYWKAATEGELAAEIAGPRASASKRASELGVTLPASIDAAFERALSVDPRARPKSAGELGRMLESKRAGSGKSVPEIVAPPPDMIAGLMKSELDNAGVKVAPAEQETTSLADEAVLLASERPPPLAPRPPALREMAAPVAASPALEEDVPPAAPRRRVGLVVGIVGAAIVLVVGAGAVALARKKSPPVVSSATATTSATSSPTASFATNPPPPPASASAAASALPPLDAEHSELVVVCEPTCDLVMIDRKRMTSYPEPTRLAPGQHGVGVSAPDHWGDWKLVETKGGERLTVTFKLRAKSEPIPAVAHTAAPVPTAAPTTSKPCGKFLKRCD